MTKSQATTPILVQLSGPEFIAFIFPHLSMPMRGPKCKLGYHRVFNLILWVLYTGMQWKCLPVPRASDGTALIHYTIIYKVFAKWTDDGSLEQAFIASVRHAPMTCSSPIAVFFCNIQHQYSRTIRLLPQCCSGGGCYIIRPCCTDQLDGRSST